MTNRLPVSEHTDRPWRIHELTRDFRVEDVWAFRAPGAGPDDFPVMMQALVDAGGLENNPPLVRFLFAVRWKLGALLGWDAGDKGFAGRTGALCDLLPDDLREPESGSDVPGLPFTRLYHLPDEAAMELANETCHGVCHFGWVRGDDGNYELRMAVLVKPNGMLGQAYMAAIVPFRYLFVYPAMTRMFERAWTQRAGAPDGSERGTPARA